jgi:hypothetical protein
MDRPMTDEQQQDLVNRFDFHAPIAAAGQAHAFVREMCLKLASDIVDLVPPGREQSLALTKLEEAMMWANAGIARNHEFYQQPTNTKGN